MEFCLLEFYQLGFYPLIFFLPMGFSPLSALEALALYVKVPASLLPQWLARGV